MKSLVDAILLHVRVEEERTPPAGRRGRRRTHSRSECRQHRGLRGSLASPFTNSVERDAASRTASSSQLRCSDESVASRSGSPTTAMGCGHRLTLAVTYGSGSLAPEERIRAETARPPFRGVGGVHGSSPERADRLGLLDRRGADDDGDAPPVIQTPDWLLDRDRLPQAAAEDTETADANAERGTSSSPPACRYR